MDAIKQLLDKVPEHLRSTVLLRAFGFAKVWLIWHVGARIAEISDEHVVVKIPLNRRTRNHLHSMYFGALAIGADCAGGMLAVRDIYAKKLPVNFVFKDMKAEFLKRAEGDVFFVCRDGRAIQAALKSAVESGERVNIPVHIEALVPDKLKDQPAARFDLTLSLKKSR